jgi:hypothetical protein
MVNETMRRHGTKSDKSCINSCERDEETRNKKHGGGGKKTEKVREIETINLSCKDIV